MDGRSCGQVGGIKCSFPLREKIQLRRGPAGVLRRGGEGGRGGVLVELKA